MAHQRCVYNKTDMDQGIHRVIDWEKVSQVSRDSYISLCVLRKYVAKKKVKSGEPIIFQRRGPPPLFPQELEQCIVD